MSKTYPPNTHVFTLEIITKYSTNYTFSLDLAIGATTGTTTTAQTAMAKE
jgi:hypothetical protein